MTELQARMSSREYSEWQAFYQLEPFGPLTQWEQAGVIATQVTNVAAGKIVVHPSDFVPTVAEETDDEEETAEPTDVLTPEQLSLKARIGAAFAEATGSDGR